MGVSNFARYKVSQHAKDRYRERIDSTATELDILKGFTRLLSQSEFLAKEHQGRLSYFDRKRSIVTLICPATYEVITVFNSMDQYSLDVNNTVSNKNVALPETEEVEETEEMNPKVNNIISDLAEQAYTAKNKEYMRLLAPLYVECGERMGNLSRLKRKDYYDTAMDELVELEDQIAALTSEREEVLTGLISFIQQGGA